MSEQKSSKRTEACKLAVLVSVFIISLAFIISYVVYEDQLDDRLKKATKVCSPHDENYDDVYTTTTQESVNWVYNLSNPLQYLQDGADAQFLELGGYSYDVEVTRANPRFSEGGGKVEYTLYSSGSFNAARSASGLAATDEINSVNVAYLTALGRARSEAVLMLSATCSRAQVGALGVSAVPVCRTEEINTATLCQCCSPTPLENSTTCSDIASPRGKAGGLVSYLAMHDGGVQLDGAPSAFPLSSGAYSALVVKKTVNQLLLGTPSSLLGLVQYTVGTDLEKIDISNTTEDLVAACSVLGHCPTLAELMGQIAQAPNMNAVIGIIKGLDCSGVIPGTSGLVDAGLTDARALELRYLAGVNCRPYTPTLAAAGLLMATAQQGSSYTCAGGATVLPCCLSAYSVPGMSSGQGLGCVMWVSGSMVTRQVYSVDEAYRYLTPSPDNELYTGCADDDMAYDISSWQGRQAIDRWYVPSTYVYPSMPWADPYIGPVTATGGVPGAMTVRNISGGNVFGRRGRGITSSYLEYDLTDGEPLHRDETIMHSQGLTTKHLTYAKKSNVGGVATNTFHFSYPDNYTAAEDEERQRTGEMPYAKLQNLRYSKDIPAIVSSPNYFGVNADIYSQSSNTDKYAAPGGGVSLFHTRDGYSPDSALLTAPAQMSAASVAVYESELRDFVKVEPASGVALHVVANNMASTFTWNCHPLVDKACGLLATAFNASDPLCYVFGTGTHLPCSNANVFTPRVRGGKVLPVFWSRANLKPEGVVEVFLEAMDTRHALAIMALVVPLVLLLVLALARPAVCGLAGSVKVAAHTPSNSDSGVAGDVESAEIVQDEDNAKYNASDNVIPLSDVQGNA